MHCIYGKNTYIIPVLNCLSESKQNVIINACLLRTVRLGAENPIAHFNITRSPCGHTNYMNHIERAAMQRINTPISKRMLILTLILKKSEVNSCSLTVILLYSIVRSHTHLLCWRDHSFIQSLQHVSLLPSPWVWITLLSLPPIRRHAPSPTAHVTAVAPSLPSIHACRGGRGARRITATATATRIPLVGV